jgi:hypothetical protein
MIEDRFIVGVGKDKFDVIAGHKLNTEPLDRAEADRLAHEPVKPAPSATIENDLGVKNLTKPVKNLTPQGAPPVKNLTPPVKNLTPHPAPAVDLRPTGWDAAGGSVGFKIRGC